MNIPELNSNSTRQLDRREVAGDASIRSVTTSLTVPAHSQGEVLRRAEGIELIGEFEGSGFKNPPLLARRADGQVVQLTKLLFEVAAASDGHRDLEAVCAVVSQRYGRTVSASDVGYLAERKLRPLGVLALPDGTTPVLKKRPPVMALRHRKPLLSERAVNTGARAFTWLHVPFVQALVLLAVAAFDVWLFFVHGIAGGLRSALYDPVLLLAVLASVIVATAFHEFGHASACRYGGARPGAMGVGLYLVWPVFYCDVTDAYRLNRAGRLRTDLGGIYFNAIFALLLGGVYFYTGEQAALLAAFLQHTLILQQLIPLMRFDGYYVMTDLTGVPDILSRIKPIFRSLLRGREHETAVAELKPWVRWVVTIYLVALVPALALLFVWMLIGLPRLIATVYQAFVVQFDLIGRVGAAETLLGAVRTSMLALQLGGIALSLVRVSQMAGRPLVRWSRGSVARRIGLVLAAIALLCTTAYVLWPGEDYRPIQPGERGTVQDGLNSLTKLASRAGVIAGHQTAVSGRDATGTVGGASGQAAAGRETAVGGGTSDPWPTTREAPRGSAGASASGHGSAPAPGPTTATTPGKAAGAPSTTGSGAPTTTRDRTSASAPSATAANTGTTMQPAAPGGTTAPTATSTDSGSTTASNPGTTTASSMTTRNSAAVAVNEVNNSLAFALTFTILSVTGNVVDENVADAYASCDRCQTVAISIQTLLVDSAASVIVPINEASARNQNCDTCDTVAIAYQFVVAAGTKLEFTPEGRRQIAYIWDQFERLREGVRGGMTGAQIVTAVASLMQQYAGILSTQLVPVSQSGTLGNGGDTSGATPSAGSHTTLAPPTGASTVPEAAATSTSTNPGSAGDPGSAASSGAAAGTPATTPTSAPTDSGTTPTTPTATTGASGPTVTTTSAQGPTTPPAEATTTTSGTTATTPSGATATTPSSTTPSTAP